MPNLDFGDFTHHQVTWRTQDVGPEQGYERIRHWLHRRCGMFYPERKRELLLHRLERLCNQHSILGGLSELADRLEHAADNALQLEVLHVASTNHTYFFREPQVLNFFRDQVLPSFIGKKARIWSAAASMGDEAYTLAIMACESGGKAWATQNFSILGTDISDPVIAQAEAGIYGGGHLEQTEPEILQRYFKPIGMDQYKVSDSLRRMCLFRRMNLKAYPYPFEHQFDVVFCRNVLYYFDPAHQQQTVESIYEVTKPGGWLMTSVTESLRGLNTRWESVGGGIYRKLL